LFLPKGQTSPSLDTKSEKTKMIRRILAALFSAFLFSIAAPIAYFFLFDAFPLEGFKGIAAVSAAGAVFGAIIGAIFPRVFGFIFEMFLDI
jgi:hypothetical protein